MSFEPCTNLYFKVNKSERYTVFLEYQTQVEVQTRSFHTLKWHTNGY